MAGRAQPPSFKTDVQRAKTKKWVEAKRADYGGDDWGGYDEYDDFEEEPPPPPKPTGLRQRGQASVASVTSATTATSGRPDSNLSAQSAQAQRSRTGSFEAGDDQSPTLGRLSTASGQQQRQSADSHRQRSPGLSPGNLSQSTSPSSGSFPQAAAPQYSRDTRASQEAPLMQAPQIQAPQMQPRPMEPIQRPHQPPGQPNVVQGRSSPSDGFSPQSRGYPEGRNVPRNAEFHQRPQYSPTGPSASVTSPGSGPSQLQSRPQERFQPPNHPAPPRKESLTSQERPSNPNLRQAAQPSLQNPAPSERFREVPPPGPARNPPADQQHQPAPTFVRPADIYRRMEAERERERQSMDSSRPSVEAIERSAGSPSPNRQGMGPVQSGPYRLQQLPENGLSKDLDTGSSSKAVAKPFEEGKSTYATESSQIEGSGGSRPTSLQVTPEPPSLPQFDRFSTFGSEFLAGTPLPARQEDVPAVPAVAPSQQTLEASAAKIQSAHDRDLPHQPSLGLQSTVDRAPGRNDLGASHAPGPQDQKSAVDDGIIKSNNDNLTGVGSDFSRVTSKPDSSSPRTGRASADATKPLMGPAPGTSEEPSAAWTQSGPADKSTNMAQQDSAESELQEARSSKGDHSKNRGTPTSHQSPVERDSTDGFSNRESDLAQTVNSDPRKYVPGAEVAENYAQKKYMNAHANPQVNPPNESRAIPSLAQVSARSESPNNSKVRGLASKFNDMHNTLSGDESPTASASPLPGVSKRSASPAKAEIPSARGDTTRFRRGESDLHLGGPGRQESPSRARPLERPNLPGTWVSYADSETSTTGGLGLTSPSSGELSGHDSVATKSVAQLRPSEIAREQSSDTIELSPTTAKVPLAGKSHPDPTQSSMAALAAAGTAIADSLKQSVGMDTEGSSELDEDTDDMVTPDVRDRAATNATLRPPTTVGDTTASTVSSAGPTPPAKDTPRDLGPQRGPGYFPAPAPLVVRNNETRREEHTEEATPLSAQSQMSTEAAPGDSEADQLRKDIAKSLTPPDGKREDRLVVTDTLGLPSDKPSSLRASSIIPHEYDRYWAGDSDRDSRNSKQNSVSMERESSAASLPAHRLEETRLGGGGLTSAANRDAPVISDAADQALQPRSTILDNRFSWEQTDDITLSGPSNIAAANEGQQEIVSPTSTTDLIKPYISVDVPSTQLPRSSGEIVKHSPSLRTPTSPEAVRSSEKPLPPTEDAVGTGLRELQPDPVELPADEEASPSAPAHRISSSERATTGHRAAGVAPAPARLSQSKLMDYKAISALNQQSERITTYQNTRAQYGTMDTGLNDWLAHMVNDHPEYVQLSGPMRPTVSTAGLAGSGRSRVGQSFGKMTRVGTGDAQSPSTTRSPETAGASPGLMASPSHSKRQDLLHSAGVLGGKASLGAKGLFAKGKSRLRGPSSEKIPESSHVVRSQPHSNEKRHSMLNPFRRRSQVLDPKLMADYGAHESEDHNRIESLQASGTGPHHDGARSPLASQSIEARPPAQVSSVRPVLPSEKEADSGLQPHSDASERHAMPQSIDHGLISDIHSFKADPFDGFDSSNNMPKDRDLSYESRQHSNVHHSIQPIGDPWQQSESYSQDNGSAAKPPEKAPNRRSTPDAPPLGARNLSGRIEQAVDNLELEDLAMHKPKPWFDTNPFEQDGIESERREGSRREGRGSSSGASEVGVFGARGYTMWEDTPIEPAKNLPPSLLNRLDDNAQPKPRPDGHTAQQADHEDVHATDHTTPRSTEEHASRAQTESTKDVPIPTFGTSSPSPVTLSTLHSHHEAGGRSSFSSKRLPSRSFPSDVFQGGSSVPHHGQQTFAVENNTSQPSEVHHSSGNANGGSAWQENAGDISQSAKQSSYTQHMMKPPSRPGSTHTRSTSHSFVSAPTNQNDPASRRQTLESERAPPAIPPQSEKRRSQQNLVPHQQQQQQQSRLSNMQSSRQYHDMSSPDRIVDPRTQAAEYGIPGVGPPVEKERKARFSFRRKSQTDAMGRSRSPGRSLVDLLSRVDPRATSSRPRPASLDSGNLLENTTTPPPASPRGRRMSSRDFINRIRSASRSGKNKPNTDEERLAGISRAPTAEPLPSPAAADPARNKLHKQVSKRAASMDNPSNARRRNVVEEESRGRQPKSGSILKRSASEKRENNKKLSKVQPGKSKTTTSASGRSSGNQTPTGGLSDYGTLPQIPHLRSDERFMSDTIWTESGMSSSQAFNTSTSAHPTHTSAAQDPIPMPQVINEQGRARVNAAYSERRSEDAPRSIQDPGRAAHLSYLQSQNIFPSRPQATFTSGTGPLQRKQQTNAATIHDQPTLPDVGSRPTSIMSLEHQPGLSRTIGTTSSEYSIRDNEAIGSLRPSSELEHPALRQSASSPATQTHRSTQSSQPSYNRTWVVDMDEDGRPVKQPRPSSTTVSRSTAPTGASRSRGSVSPARALSPVYTVQTQQAQPTLQSASASRQYQAPWEYQTPFTSGTGTRASTEFSNKTSAKGTPQQQTPVAMPQTSAKYEIPSVPSFPMGPSWVAGLGRLTGTRTIVEGPSMGESWQGHELQNRRGQEGNVAGRENSQSVMNATN